MNCSRRKEKNLKKEVYRTLGEKIKAENNFRKEHIIKKIILFCKTKKGQDFLEN